jgi:hypothetical protein
MKIELFAVSALGFLIGVGIPHASVSGFVHPDFRWRKGSTIPVCFENPNTSNLAGRKMVEYIVKNSWEKIANINFDFQTSACATSNKGIMIKITDTEQRTCNGKNTPQRGRPGTCTKWEEGEAKWAKMHLNFTFETFKGAMSPVAVDTALRRKQINRMIFHYTIHEFGHAIGFLHETDRIEGKRDAGAQSCSDDDGENLVGGVSVSYYDIHSVMHYLCNQAGNWPNGPPVTLSCGDMATARWMYGDRNSSIGPSCLEANAKTTKMPQNFPAGYTVPSGTYDIGAGSDSYVEVTNPTYSVSSINNWGGTRNRKPNPSLTYVPTMEPKITMGMSPESKTLSGQIHQGYRLTFTFHDTTILDRVKTSQAWIQELTLLTVAGPITVYRDNANPKDNKPLWAYPQAGEYNDLYYCIRDVNSGRNTSLDRSYSMTTPKLSATNRTWSFWIQKGQDQYRDAQDQYGFLFQPPFAGVYVQSANSDGLYYADMNFYAVNARITYWDGAWYESINIKGAVPRNPGFVQYFYNKDGILTQTIPMANSYSPTHYLHVGKTEVTRADYFLATSNRVPHSMATLNFSDAKLPMGGITWYDAIVYCNLRSELEGLEKVYSYTNPVYAQGTNEFGGHCLGMSQLKADHKKNGYRLPSEQEWMAFYSPPGPGEYYWTSQDDGNQYAWFGNGSSGLMEVGQKRANSRGIYDLSGNAAEYVWAEGGSLGSNSADTFLKGGTVASSVADIGRSSRNYIVKYDPGTLYCFRVVRTVRFPWGTVLSWFNY